MNLKALSVFALSVALSAQTLNVSPQLTPIPNDQVTGTILYGVAKLNSSGQAVAATVADTSGFIGIVQQTSGTFGNAGVAASGQARCNFDNATSAGDYVGSFGSFCHDLGSALPAGPYLGRVLSTHGGAGTYGLLIQMSSGASGSGGSTGPITWGTINGTLSLQADLQAALSLKQAVLGFVPENVTNKGQPNGYAPLNSSGLVPAANLAPFTLGFTAENAANKGVGNGYAPLNGSSIVPTVNLPPFQGPISANTYDPFGAASAVQSAIQANSLQKSANLSDVADRPTALANLGGIGAAALSNQVMELNGTVLTKRLNTNIVAGTGVSLSSFDNGTDTQAITISSVGGGTGGTPNPPGGTTNAIQTNSGSGAFGGVANNSATKSFLNQTSGGVALFSPIGTGDVQGLGTVATHPATDFDASGLAAAVGASSLQKTSNLSDLGSASAARVNLGLGTASTQPIAAFDPSGAAAATSASALQKSNNLSDILSALTARNNLGLGTAATQASTAFDVAGAAANGLQVTNNLGDLSNPTVARTNLGLGTSATQASSAYDAAGAAISVGAGSLQKSANLADVSNSATVRTNLGLGTAATSAATAFDPAGAATTVGAASLQKTSNLADVQDIVISRTNLGLGTAAVAAASSFDPAGAAAAVTSSGLQKTSNLSDLQNVITARTNLGLGTAATQAATNFDASGAAAAVAASSLQKASNLADVSVPATARTNLGLGTAATQPSTAFDVAGAATAAQAAVVSSSLQKASNLSDVASPATALANLGGVGASAAGLAAPIQSIKVNGSTVAPVGQVVSITIPTPNIALQTNGVANTSQTTLNLAAGANVALSESAGTVTVSASSSGGTSNPPGGAANALQINNGASAFAGVINSTATKEFLTQTSGGLPVYGVISASDVGGLGTAATQPSSAFDVSGAAIAAQGLSAQKSLNLSDLASISAARTNLGLGTAALAAASSFDVAGAAATAQGLSAQKAANLSDLADPVVARASLGLGTSSTTAASSYDVAGAASAVSASSAQKANNLSDLASPATARTNLGLGTAATSAATAFDVAGAAAAVSSSSAQKANNLSDLSSALTARNNLGLGTSATTASSSYDAVGAAATAQSLSTQKAANGSDFVSPAQTLINIGGTTLAAATAAAPVQSVAGRAGAVTINHNDLTDWASATSTFQTGPTAFSNITGLATSNPSLLTALNGKQNTIPANTYDAFGAATASQAAAIASSVQKSANLSDVANPATSLANLGGTTLAASIAAAPVQTVAGQTPSAGNVTVSSLNLSDSATIDTSTKSFTAGAFTYNYSGAAATTPTKSGTPLPATCSIGNLFFLTSAVAGQNLYSCTAINVWTAPSSSSTGTVTAVNGIAPVSGNVTIPTVNAAGNGIAVSPAGNPYLWQPGRTGVTGDTITSSDCGKVVNYSSAGAVNATLTQPTVNMTSGCPVRVFNYGAGTVTLTPNASTIAGSSSLVLAGGTATHPTLAVLYNDGANYTVGENSATGGGGGATLPTTPAVLKGNNAGGAVAAVAGTDYASPMFTNVRECGAVGDGVTIDGPAIAACETQALANNSTLFFPRGNYAVNAPVEIAGSIEADSLAVVIMVGATTQTAVLNFGSTSAVSNKSISNLTVDANGKATNAIFLRQYKHLVLRNMHARNALVNGFHLGDPSISGGSAYDAISWGLSYEMTNAGTLAVGSIGFLVDSATDSQTTQSEFLDAETGVQVRNGGHFFTDIHAWAHPSHGIMLVGFDDFAGGNFWKGCEPDTVGQYGFRMRGSFSVITGARVFNNNATGSDNVLIGVHFDSVTPSTFLSGNLFVGQDAAHRLAQDWDSTSSSIYTYGNLDQNVTAPQVQILKASSAVASNYYLGSLGGSLLHAGPGGTVFQFANSSVTASVDILFGPNTAGGTLLHFPGGGVAEMQVGSGAEEASLIANAITSQSLVPATAAANFNSPLFTTGAKYYNGTASVSDSFTIQDVVGAGATPTSTLAFSHTGSPGAVSVSFPGSFQAVGNVTLGSTSCIFWGPRNRVCSPADGTMQILANSGADTAQLQVNDIVSSGFISANVSTVTPSATLTFDLSKGDQAVTLNAAVTSSIATNITKGQRVMFQVCNGATVYAFRWPTTGFHGGGTVGTTANTCSTQPFESFDGTNMYAIGPMIINQ